jgi:DNA-binding Lrp family transcriptional regulator
MPGWTFITNHARVLMCIAENPDARLRDIAQQVDITERATQRIVGELVDAGYLTRQRVGRRNRYKVHGRRPIRAPEADNVAIGDVLNLLLSSSSTKH